MMVIYNTQRKAYWSCVTGWTSIEDADVFSYDAAELMPYMPVGGVWLDTRHIPA
jgi:hypothetical protein